MGRVPPDWSNRHYRTTAALPVPHRSDGRLRVHCALLRPVTLRVRLVHITDPHLTSLAGWRPGPRSGKRWLSWLSWYTGRSERHRRERLDALVDALRREQPDIWAVTGDLCQIGLERETADARRWLEGLARPETTLVVPGNHDIFANDSAAWIHRDWAEYLHVDPERPKWPVVRRHGDVVLIGLNSAIVTPVFRARGRIGREARARMERLLDAHRGAFRVVLIHHPPLPGTCKARKALVDDREISTLLTRHGPGLVLHGHLHRNRCWPRTSEQGHETRVYCTGSASAAGKQGAAAARIFEIERRNGGFDTEMRLIELDENGRLRTAEHDRWEAPG